MSAYSISATTWRCEAVPCSSTCCTTKFPKVCRHNCEAPVKTSSSRPSVCQVGQYSMRRSKTRQPKRWRAVTTAWPFISSKMNCKFSGGNNSTHFWRTWLACGEVDASRTWPLICSAIMICSCPVARSRARCTTRQPAGEAARGQACSRTQLSANWLFVESSPLSCTKAFSHSASEGEGTCSELCTFNACARACVGRSYASVSSNCSICNGAPSVEPLSSHRLG
mmetsp:Transcript_102973/g.289575  ORF Transcript_102973/g.289575 Transcript_102973/m.289575 type:complete len:224 (+) Transcript_102973:427-1098(+)